MRNTADGSPGGGGAAPEVTTVGAAPMPDGPPMAVSSDDDIIVAADAVDELAADMPAREFESRRRRFRSAPRFGGGLIPQRLVLLERFRDDAIELRRQRCCCACSAAPDRD